MKMFGIEILSKTDHIKPMSLRGGTTKQSRSYSRKHILTAQNFYMPQNFGIFVCTTARFPLIKREPGRFG
jgi:hypothetical protein